MEWKLLRENSYSCIFFCVLNYPLDCIFWEVIRDEFCDGIWKSWEVVEKWKAKGYWVTVWGKRLQEVEICGKLTWIASCGVYLV